MPVPLIDSAGSSSNDTEKSAVSSYIDKNEHNIPLPHRRPSSAAEAIDPESLEQQRLDDAESLASIQEPPTAEEAEEGASIGPPPKVYAAFSLEVLVSLMGASVFGSLARLGLLGLTTYDGRAIFPLAWVQAAGCLVMGFFLGIKDQTGAFYGPLYTAVTTGFCGSLTTFSSWQFDVFSSWANTADAHHDWFRDVIDGLAKTIFTLAISLSSVTLGLHFARLISRRFPRVPPAAPWFGILFSALSVLVYAATFPAYFRASPSFRHKATAPMLFSFPGTLTRYVLAVKLTPLFTLFPLGTFIANTTGTALLGAFHILQRLPRHPSQSACAILEGLIDGYCGCLTTVSTFAVEVGALKSKRAWLYVILSWGVSQLLLLIIVGSSWWGGGVDESNMCTFATN